MTADPVSLSDFEFLGKHRRIWAARPELRAVYHGYFRRLLREAGDRRPLVEFGAGPGFFKEFCPQLISTDVIAGARADVTCDACALPFRDGSVGAVVMLDVLHHLDRPLEFMERAAHALAPGGRIAMIEPWITPASYILYRYFHHEDCRLGIDIERPFTAGKKAFDGNATIPFQLARHYGRNPHKLLRLIRCEPFLGLEHLASLGFQRSRPMPGWLVPLAGQCERVLGPVGRWNATRAILVWEKA